MKSKITLLMPSKKPQSRGYIGKFLKTADKAIVQGIKDADKAIHEGIKKQMNLLILESN